jgi:hypothetical protein
LGWKVGFERDLRDIRDQISAIRKRGLAWSVREAGDRWAVTDRPEPEWKVISDQEAKRGFERNGCDCCEMRVIGFSLAYSF